MFDDLLGAITPVPDDKILTLSKMKAFADDKINVTEKLSLVLGRVENIVEKGENTGYQHFILFPQFFQQLSFKGSLKFGVGLAPPGWLSGKRVGLVIWWL